MRGGYGMESGEIVSEKHLSNGRGKYHDPVFQVREFDLVGDLGDFLPIFWQSWLLVHGEDKSSMRRIKILDKEWEVTEAEALVYWYLHDEHSRISIALSDNEIVGFVIYNPIIEGVFAIRMLYVVPNVQGTKVGQKLISSIEKLRTLIFQTKKHIEPETMFKSLKSRHIKLNETDTTVTWSMNWETQ